MPRRPRVDLAGYHHIINRGVNRSLSTPIKNRTVQVTSGKVDFILVILQMMSSTILLCDI